ncbi:MAG: family 20 glycosylhydrolase [Bacteroidota bacterium]
MKKLVFLIVLIFISISLLSSSYDNKPVLMPIPQKLEWKTNDFKIDSSFSISFSNTSMLRLKGAIERFNMRLDGRVLKYFKKEIQVVGKLKINSKSIAEVKLGMDESYQLSVSNKGVIINSNTDIGAIRALETLLQLIIVENGQFYFKACEIEDSPRFQWRGLMIDVCRHFISKDVVLKNLDAMAALKMNVLHLHLSEDQGFRIESKKFPKLHELGSNGKYFTQQEVKEIIKYADDRGIRVVPEFDLPGHSTAWFVAFPEFASASGPYVIEKKFGVFDPTFNPANEKIYPFFETFFKEMCTLFPDAYMHIGGDENNGNQWNHNPVIQQFIKDKKLDGNHGLQAYFNQKLYKILNKNGKKMIGWDEIMSPQLPKDILIQSWRGKDAMINAAKQGIPSILSNNYYIDLNQPTWFHYQNDPLPSDIELNDEQKKIILGGEATMWSELVTDETIDSRIWPRTAAIAERLWSAESVKDPVDMYFRLEKINILLEELGVSYIKNQEMLTRRFLGGKSDEDFASVLEMIEPSEVYTRQSFKPYSTDIPFCQLPDIAFPDSKFAIAMFINNEQYLKSKDNQIILYSQKLINDKKQSLENLLFKINEYPNLLPYNQYFSNLKDALELYSSLITKISNNTKDEEWLKGAKFKTELLSKPVAELEIGFIKEFKKMLKYYEEAK